MEANRAYEKLGLFYLGREIGDNGETIAPMLLRSRDLTTHGVIIGMTGSGKTGLGIDQDAVSNQRGWGHCGSPCCGLDYSFSWN